MIWMKIVVTILFKNEASESEETYHSLLDGMKVVLWGSSLVIPTHLL
jgi:hypothetical protein